MAGGTLLLRRVALGDPTAFQVTWLRAFHAHGGVLFVLSLDYFLLLSQTTVSMSMKHLASLALFSGIGASREDSSSRRSWGDRTVPRSESQSRSAAPSCSRPRLSFLCLA